MSGSATPSENMHKSVPYIMGFGAAILTMIGVISGFQLFSNFKIVDTQSYASLREIEEKYYSKEFIASHYLDKVEVSEKYMKRSEVESGYLSIDKVKNSFVTAGQFEVQLKENRALIDTLNGIPSPFKPIVKVLSDRGQWNSEQLGVSISMKRISALASQSYYAEFFLALPDSPLHVEGFYSTEISRCRWTFTKSGRDFELKIEKFDPMTFSVREI